MKKWKILCGCSLLMLLFVGVYIWSHPLGWSKDLTGYLDDAAVITGEVVWRGDAVPGEARRIPLSAEQTERVLDAVKRGAFQDNREFAGTTEPGLIMLNVDGERVSVSCIVDTELQYSWKGEKRSVRTKSEGYAQALREIMREVLPEGTELEAD